jgi:hypothetical protein
MSYPTCDHLKEDGVLCGSPSLRGKKLCFYHHRDYQRRQYVERILRLNDPLRPNAPLPKNWPDLQIKLYEVITALADERIHTRRAGKLLYALQKASISLRQSAS